jgi:hypothetical protein
MYKKITHNIVEEHFGHPSAPQIRRMVEKNIKSTMAPVNVDAFKNNIKDYFTDYNKKMTAVLAGVTGSPTELEDAQEAIFATIDNIGNFTKPYYGVDFGEKLNQSFRGFALTMATAVNYVRSGLDVKTLTNDRIVNILAKDLGKMLFAYNNNWNPQVTQNFWIQICNHWIDAAKARLRKDTVEEQAALANATKVMDTFSNSLAWGITSQFADQFTTAQMAID